MTLVPYSGCSQSNLSCSQASAHTQSSKSPSPSSLFKSHQAQEQEQDPPSALAAVTPCNMCMQMWLTSVCGTAPGV